MDEIALISLPCPGKQASNAQILISKIEDTSYILDSKLKSKKSMK